MAERERVDDRIGGRAVDVQGGSAAREDGLEVGARYGWRDAVEYLAVALRDGGDVEGGLHATLYLERGDACGTQGGEMLVETQVAHRERQRLVAGGVGVREPAAVGAASAVAAAVLLHGGEEAESGDGVAERAVDEHLYLHATSLGDGLDVLERELAREDDAGEAKLLQGEDALEVMGDELRGGVQRE